MLQMMMPTKAAITAMYLLEGDVDPANAEIGVEVVLECQRMQVQLVWCTCIAGVCYQEGDRLCASSTALFRIGDLW